MSMARRIRTALEVRHAHRRAGPRARPARPGGIEAAESLERGAMPRDCAAESAILSMPRGRGRIRGTRALRQHASKRSAAPPFPLLGGEPMRFRAVATASSNAPARR